MAVHNQSQVNRAVKGGAIAGLVAGAVLSVLLAIINAVEGRDVFIGLKFAGVPFLGPRVFEPGFDGLALVIGLACHFAVSVFFGVLFGLIFYGLSKGATLLAGILWGLVSWVVMLYVVLPVLGLPAGGAGSPAMAIFTHVVFGVVLAATFLPFQEELRAPRRTTAP